MTGIADHTKTINQTQPLRQKCYKTNEMPYIVAIMLTM